MQNGIGSEESYRNLSQRVGEALEVADQFGVADGAHHKAWVIDQMVRALTCAEYETWIAQHKAGVDGPETYSWDEGIAP